MAILKNEHKMKCSCLKGIQNTQKSTECKTCGNCFHAVSGCLISFEFNETDNDTIELCQNCLTNALPFQTLDDLEYEFTVLKGSNISETNMDRLRHLKFNPFKKMIIILV